MCLAVLVASAAPLALAEDFYRDKTLKIIVPYSPGGGVDLVARIVGRYLPGYIPGEPEIVVENRTGAGGLVALNYLLSAAPKDGLTISIAFLVQVLEDAIGRSRLNGGAKELVWLGAPTSSTDACFILASAAPEALDSLAKSGREISMGGIRQGTPQSDLPLLVNKLHGTRFKVVNGYKGASHIYLALRQKEVEGICNSAESVRSSVPDLLDGTAGDRLVPVVAFGNPDLEDYPELRGVPQIPGENTSADARRIFELYIDSRSVSRIFVAARGVPDSRIGILRAALARTFSDERFVSEAEAAGLVIKPAGGEEIGRVADRILATPPEMVSLYLRTLEVE